MSRGWSHVIHVEKIKPCLRNNAHWAVVMSLMPFDNRYQFVDSLVALVAAHNLGRFLWEHTSWIPNTPDHGVLPELLMQIMQATYKDKDLSQAWSSCKVVESLVSRRLVIGCEQEALHWAWELAVRNFDHATEIDDDALFPDWQIMACRMVFCLLKYDADPNAKIKARIYCPYLALPLVDERSVLCIVEEALRAFQSRRGVGVQQLTGAVTLLRDRLVQSLSLIHI